MTRNRTGDVAGLAAVGLAVCCGLPVLLGAGALSAAVGVAVGSGLVALVGLTVAGLGWLRWRRRRQENCVTVDAPPRAS